MRRLLVVSATALAVGLGIWPGIAGGARQLAQATFSQPTLSGCNALAFGYAVGGHKHQLGAKAAGCFTMNFGDQTISYPVGSKLTLYLDDVSCNATYFSNGKGTADHAAIFGTGPYRVDIADAGSGCVLKRTNTTPTEGLGNFDATSTANVG
jgi:hypothetical protein